MVVANAESTAYIDILNDDMIALKLVLQFVDTVAQSLEVAHVKYLTTNMEVQSHKLHVLHLCRFFYRSLHVLHGNAEFVFCKSGSDIGMSMCAHVRVDTESHSRHLASCCCKLVDNFQLGDALYIEAENILVESEVNLPVAFAHSGVYYLRWCKTCIDGSLYLATAHAVGTKTSLADYVEHFWIGISLHRIVHMVSWMLVHFVVDSLQGLA